MTHNSELIALADSFGRVAIGAAKRVMKPIPGDGTAHANAQFAANLFAIEAALRARAAQ